MRFRLRSMTISARLGATGLVAALGMGLVASALHLRHHYEKRDGAPGLTLDDITAAYRGLEAPSRFVAALRRGHPDDLPAAERDALLAWLASERITEDYDSLDLGDDAPAEVIARSCLSCHSRSASPPADQARAKDLPLDYFDDVKKIAFARSVPATPREIVLMSMHAHAPALATMSVAIGAMGLATAFPRRLVGALIGAAGLALAADLACWLLARVWAPAVQVIVGAGFVYNAATALLLALILIELWRPLTASEKKGGTT
ncbi:MAG: hypothetical protein IBJ10_02145 [Phycisphaerales bacterium]|nr:hypothetical protein [Phycisphaerales bacterium]